MRHPIHPILVHLPIACWLLAPACDVAALAGLPDFFWQAAALLSGAGVAAGALAATVGAIELERAKGAARRTALIHASIMGTAWVIGLAALLGRLGDGMAARLPAPLWVVAGDGLTAVLLLAGAFFGGELVYRHGVGVRRDGD